MCISSVGCSDGIVNLYDSLYHNVISKEVEEQAINLVGTDSFSGLNVVQSSNRQMDQTVVFLPLHLQQLWFMVFPLACWSLILQN